MTERVNTLRISTVSWQSTVDTLTMQVQALALTFEVLRLRIARIERHLWLYTDPEILHPRLGNLEQVTVGERE